MAGIGHAKQRQNIHFLTFKNVYNKHNIFVATVFFLKTTEKKQNERKKKSKTTKTKSKNTYFDTVLRGRHRPRNLKLPKYYNKHFYFWS